MSPEALGIDLVTVIEPVAIVLPTLGCPPVSVNQEMIAVSNQTGEQSLSWQGSSYSVLVTHTDGNSDFATSYNHQPIPGGMAYRKGNDLVARLTTDTRKVMTGAFNSSSHGMSYDAIEGMIYWVDWNSGVPQLELYRVDPTSDWTVGSNKVQVGVYTPPSGVWTNTWCVTCPQASTVDIVSFNGTDSITTFNKSTGSGSHDGSTRISIGNVSLGGTAGECSGRRTKYGSMFMGRNITAFPDCWNVFHIPESGTVANVWPNASGTWQDWPDGLVKPIGLSTESDGDKWAFCGFYKSSGPSNPWGVNGLSGDYSTAIIDLCTTPYWEINEYSGADVKGMGIRLL